MTYEYSHIMGSFRGAISHTKVYLVGLGDYVIGNALKTLDSAASHYKGINMH